MKLKTKKIPSVFESNATELVNVADDLVSGLKIEIDNTSYLVGDLALVEGTSPHKGINSAPSDLDYRLLLYAALALAKVGADRPMKVATGFPYSSYEAYRETAEHMIKGEHRIQFDGRTFGGSAYSVMEVVAENVDIMPEIEGLIKAVRKGEIQESDPFFAVSLGYGTFEAVLSLPSGPVKRTATSGNGIRFATRRMTEKLQQKHYLDMLTEHQMDVAMQEGEMIVGRRRIDLADLRRKVLQTYYEDVISPALQKAFSDSDFGRARKMYIAGGGVHYDELIGEFKSEFDEILDVNVVPNPGTIISRGFALRASEIDASGNQQAVGIDIGNANTVVTLAESDPVSKVKALSEEEAPVEKTPAEKKEHAEEAPAEEEVLSSNVTDRGKTNGKEKTNGEERPSARNQSGSEGST